MELTIKLTQEEVQLILGSLQENPYRLVHLVIAKIQAQASKQLAPPRADNVESS